MVAVCLGAVFHVLRSQLDKKQVVAAMQAFVYGAPLVVAEASGLEMDRE